MGCVATWRLGDRMVRVATRLIGVTLVLTCALSVAMQGATSSPAAARAVGETAAERQRARARTTAWIVTWDRTRVLASLRANRTRVGRISPFWFRLRHDGAQLQNRPGAMDREVLQVAAEAGIAVVPTITNDFDPVRTTTVLRSEGSRARHVRQIVGLASRPAFAGIDLDYEQVALADRVKFTAFVVELASALHARGRTLSVSVPAATSVTMGLPGFAAVDYRTIGRAADEVRVLAYDYNTYCGGSGPIAPIDWVEDVVEYLKGEVPRRKLVLGVPLYGYDWPPNGCSTSRSWRDTIALRNRHQGELAWSRPWQTRRMRYTVRGARRIVWFEDAASTAAKARLVERHRLRGVALWRMGGEDPATWPQLQRILGRPRT